MTELPMTVSGTSVDNVVSLLSKKPKKSCLSKPRTCSVSRSPSTPTENTVPPMGSGEVTSMVSSTSQKQSFDEGAMKEVGEAGEPIVFIAICDICFINSSVGEANYCCTHVVRNKHFRVAGKPSLQTTYANMSRKQLLSILFKPSTLL